MYYDSFNQPWVFLYMLCGGVVMGLLYDVFRIARRALRTGAWVTAALDISYWALGTIVMAAAFYSATQGELRFYMFAGIITGMAIYLLGMSKLIMGAFGHIMKGVEAVGRWWKKTPAAKWLSR